MVRFLLLMMVFWPFTAWGEGAAPENTSNDATRFDTGLGINIKTERVTPAELYQIAALGIKRVRIAIPWYGVEKEEGVYRWDYAQMRHPSADDYTQRRAYNYDEIIAQIVARGLKIDLTLHESNGIHTGDPVAVAGDTAVPPAQRLPAPRTPEAIQAFARFAAATVQHYRVLYGDDVIQWHIWNEPDQNGSFAPEADGEVFGQLMEATCTAIRAVAPQAKIMGPALSATGDGDLNYKFIDAMFAKANPLPCLNGFTIHPYRAFVPETVAADYAIMARHLARWQPPPPAAPVPIAVDEWGSSTARQPAGKAVPFHERWRDFSDREQAALLLRFYLTNLTASIPLTVLYDWRDRGTDPTEREDHFGVLNYAGEPKAAYQMLQFMLPLLSGRAARSDIAHRCSAPIHAVYFGASATDAKTGWLVLWREQGSATIKLSHHAGVVRDMVGESIAGQASDALPISTIPIVLPYDLTKPPSLLDCS